MNFCESCVFPLTNRSFIWSINLIMNTFTGRHEEVIEDQLLLRIVL